MELYSWLGRSEFCGRYFWLRASLPRFRYDQLMHLGWKILIPLAIFNVVLTGAAILFWPQLKAMF